MLSTNSRPSYNWNNGKGSKFNEKCWDYKVHVLTKDENAIINIMKRMMLWNFRFISFKFDLIYPSEIKIYITHQTCFWAFFGIGFVPPLIRCQKIGTQGCWSSFSINISQNPLNINIFRSESDIVSFFSLLRWYSKTFFRIANHCQKSQSSLGTGSWVAKLFNLLLKKLFLCRSLSFQLKLLYFAGRCQRKHCLWTPERRYIYLSLHFFLHTLFWVWRHVIPLLVYPRSQC